MPPKAGKKEKITCVDHVFSLRAKNSLCYYHNPLSIDICKRATMGRGKKEVGDCYEGPVFNKDKNCQTPTFVLASDRKKFESIEFKTGIESDLKYANLKYEKSMMLVPKPNSKNMYCSVCKQRYEDYLDHISGVRHKANIQRNTFTHYILEQVQNFKEKDPIHSASSTAETSNFIVISSDEQPKEKNKQMGKPRKKVKKCEDYRPSKQTKQIHPKQKVSGTNPPPLNPDLYQQMFLCNPMAPPYPMSLNFNYNFNMMGMPNFGTYNEGVGQMVSLLGNWMGHQQMNEYWLPMMGRQSFNTKRVQNE